MSEHIRILRPLLSVVVATVAAVLVALPSDVSSRTSVGESAVVSGRAKVQDGDTLEIAGTRIRLEGIDAPEHDQTCGRKGAGIWSCGAAATNQLKRLTRGRKVTCESAGVDTYGRMLGLCSVDGVDINAEMVRTGYAWAFVRYSTRYVPAEREARRAEAGIWQGQAEPAWAFRERRRAQRLGQQR